MVDRYILVEKEVRPVSLITWGEWLEMHNDDRIVKRDDINGRFVSTVFLAYAHSFNGGPLLLFETLVFPSRTEMREIYCDRCTTYSEAEAMHVKACDWVRSCEVPHV